MIDLSNFAGEVSCRIAAPAERVWDLLADLSLTPRVNRETVETVWVPPATAWEVGAVFTATNRLGDRTWTVECHVTVADRPQELGWAVLEPAHPSSVWWYRLDTVGHETVVTQGFQHGPNTSGLRMAAERDPGRAERIIAARKEQLLANMEHTLGEIRRLAEAG